MTDSEPEPDKLEPDKLEPSQPDKPGGRKRKSRKKNKKVTHEDVSNAILAALDIAAEYRAMGVEFTRDKPSPTGWLECHAFGRPGGEIDRHPSAAVNVHTGRYTDLSGKTNPQSFWDFAATHGPHADWRAAREFYRQKTGVPPHEPPPKPAIERLTVRPWDDVAAGLWCRRKPGPTVESLKANGAILANWPASSNRYPVIALPVYGPRLLAADPVNYMVWHRGGRELPSYRIDGTVRRMLKMRTVGDGSGGTGLMGRYALERLTNFDPATDVRPQWIIKTAGPTDMLTLFARIPPESRDKYLVLCNSHGEVQVLASEFLRIFTGHQVLIVHDADDAGEVGALKWKKSLASVAAKVGQVKLPYLVADSHGRDLRDWLNGVEE